jgi:hypothetical protein
MDINQIKVQVFDVLRQIDRHKLRIQELEQRKQNLLQKLGELEKSGTEPSE